jgi:sulfhydrogenase subunit beta (sulfur reductase)
MSGGRIPVGSTVFVEKSSLALLAERLRDRGYRVIGPRVADGAMVYGDLPAGSDLPRGYLDEQDGGKYRLRREGDAYFDYVVGPHSLKNYLFPSRATMLEMQRTPENDWEYQIPADSSPPLAVLGVRSCDLHAVRIQDRVFLEGPYVDPHYQARRAGLFLVAVNCRRAAPTCFCHSMNTGPRVSEGHDLALTELDDGFVVLVGSSVGGDVLAELSWSPCTRSQLEAAEQVSADLLKQMQARPVTPPPQATSGAEARSITQASSTTTSATTAPEESTSVTESEKPSTPVGRHLDTRDIRNLLLENLEHAHWGEVAKRCLACANCTLVCPTCFCSTVEEVPDLTGDHVRRDRKWASCFMGEHSYMNSGTVRNSTQSQYRQWLTHKLGSWWDQYDSSGCTGCGRCITWCPVGIDLTAEVAALRGGNQRD